MHWLNYSEGNPQQETGFPTDVLDYIWNKYSIPLQLNPEYFYCGLCFLHSKVKWKEFKRFLNISQKKFATKIIPTLSLLANQLNEIHWNDRLNFSNHTPIFPLYFTGMVDTVPIVISQPTKFSHRRFFYNPKYKACVVKIQLVISFLGHIIYFSGPHLGITPDCKIWHENRPILEDDEWILGDGAYVAEAQILSPFRRSPNQSLTEEQLFFNLLISHYRARVEHINSLLKFHGIYQGNFRSSVDLLVIAVRIHLHFISVQLKMFPRYQPYGNWPHFNN